MANPGGSSWGSTPNRLGDAGGVVTWSIAGGGENLAFFRDANGNSVNPASAFRNLDYQGLLRQSFNDWSRYGNIEFMQVEDPGGAAGQVLNPDIRVFFGDLPGSTLGIAYFPPFGGSSPGAGDMILDTVSWLDRDPDTFKGLALHEIGHALGLGHVPQGTNSVMTPSLSRTSLQQDDINGIRQVYGAQDNAAPVYNMDDGQVRLNILNSPTNIIVNGNARNNQIDGTSTAETFNGGDGADLLIGRAGADRLNGGAGNDTIYGNQNNDHIRAGSGSDTVYGGKDNDVIFGEFGNDTIQGNKGNDTIYGNHNNDLLYGNDGNDVIYGGKNNDTIYGGAGFDTIHGNKGDDLLVGQFNADIFVFRDGDGNDTIGDFDARNGFEKIDLSRVSAITSLSDLKNNHATQSGNDVVINASAGQSITLTGVSLSDLDSTDFIF